MSNTEEYLSEIAIVEEPIVTVEEKKEVIVEEPIVTVEEPIVTLEEKKQVIVEEPIVTVEEPIVTVEEPIVTVEEPIVTVEEPIVTVEEKKEVIVEEKKEVTVEEELFPDFTDKTLAEVFLYILKKNYKLNKARELYYIKIGIPLNKDIIEIMNKIININPTFLSEIEKSILNIVKDNKIDSSDIPDFITLLQMLYEKLYNLKDYNLDNSKLSETSSTIIKFILHALVEEKKIVIDDDKKILFLSQSDKLIDACMNLLHFHHNLKAKDCCTIM